MNNLPDLPLFEILSKLSKNDLKSVCLSNKKLLKFLTNNEYFWQQKIELTTPIKFKYYPSWYSTYKHISQIPIFVNIDNSHLFRGTWIYLYTGGENPEKTCNYEQNISQYIDYYPGNDFKKIVDQIQELYGELILNFVALYIKDQRILKVSSHPSKLTTTYEAGIIPNKILIFNDSYISHSVYNLCFLPHSDNESEYYREKIRMFCKRMVQQYPHINIQQLMEPLEGDERIDLEF